MQAIILCELFSRFRGRRPVTRPSNRFESVFSRVSAPQSFASSSSSFSVPLLPLPTDGNDGLASFNCLTGSGAWPSDSSSPSDDGLSFSFSFTSIPTSPAIPITRTNPYGNSFLSRGYSANYSAGSPSFSNLDPMASPYGSPSQWKNHFVSSSGSPPSPSYLSSARQHRRCRPRSTPGPGSRQPFWAALFDPARYAPRLRHPFLDPVVDAFPIQQTQYYSLDHTVQQYSPFPPASQMLYSGPDMPYSGLLLGAEPDRLPSDDQRWRAWLDLEARRRLLTAAFIVDLHTSLFQQQRRVQNFDIHTLPSIPLTGPSAALWEAESAEAWAAQLAADPEAETPTFAPPSGILTPNDMDSRPPFDRAALLCVEMLHLPRNQAGLRHSISPAAVGTDPETDVLELHLPPPQHQQHFQPADDPPQYRCYDNLVAEARIAALFRTPRAAAYLALHHVPLHDLLAVSGDSWVFSQKVLPASSYQRNRRRLKLWADQQHGSATNHPAASGCVGADMMAGMSAARATVYAARAILGFVEREADGSWWSRDMSDYWALYVCALIVWAWNHGARGDRFPHGAGAGAGARAGGGAPHDGEGAAADRDALRWLRLVADVAIERAETEVVQARGWWEADAVVGLVRRRLQRDCVGRWSRLYVEAVRVLERLEESADAGSGRASGGLPNSW